jgi:hypothetical protein
LLPYDCGIDGERQKETIMRIPVVTELMSLDGVVEEFKKELAKKETQR